MAGKIFDINCDMGEGYGNWRMADDRAVMPLITTANIACGFHAGDPLIMQDMVEMARANGVAVGAHPGLPDKLGFGRRMIAVTPQDLYAYVVYQVGALQGFCAAAGVPLNHVKPHGILFHAVRDPALAEATLDAIAACAPGAAIYWSGPAGREPFANRARERGFRVAAEAYPDLGYTDDGSLIVEREKRPVDPAVVYRRVSEIVTRGTLTNDRGAVLPMEVESFCIHSDLPNALEVIDAARRAILDSGATIGCATRRP